MAEYNITIKNNGDGVDDIELEVLTPPTRWHAYLSLTYVQLSPYGSATAVLFVQSPSDGTVQDSATITVKALMAGQLESQVSTTTRIIEERMVDLWSFESIKKVPIGASLCTFNLTLENKGTITDDYKIYSTAWMLNSPPSGWALTLSETTVKLEPHKVKKIIATVSVPAFAKSNDFSVFTFNVTSVNVLSVFDNNGFVKTMVDPTYFMQFEWNQSNASECTRQIDSGASAVYSLNVTNLGKHTDTALLETFNDTREGWACALSSNNVTLAVNQTSQLNLTVSAPGMSNAFESFLALVRVMSEHNQSSYFLDGAWNYIVTLTSIRQMHNASYVLTPQSYNVTETNVSTMINMTMSLSNLGNYYDTFRLTIFPLPVGWAMIPKRTDIESYEFALPRNGSITLPAMLVLPKNASAGDHTIKTRAYNEAFESYANITVFVPEFRMIAFWIYEPETRAFPGETVKFYPTVTNLGNYYALTNFSIVPANATNATNVTYPSWGITFFPSNVINLSLGKTLEFMFSITVPEGTPRGKYFLALREGSQDAQFTINVIASRAGGTTTTGDDMCPISFVMLIVILVAVFVYFKLRPPPKFGSEL